MNFDTQFKESNIVLDGKESSFRDYALSRQMDRIILSVTVDGSWTPWSAFTSCDYICGAGTSNRTRTCTDPAPANGGNTCLGDDHQSQACTGSCMGE